MNRKELIVVSILLAAVLFFLIRPAFLAPYNVEDDYHYIKIGNPQLGYFQKLENPRVYSGFGEFFKKYNSESGRFRPFSVFYLWCISKTASSDIRITEGAVFLFALMVLLFFYVLMRLFRLHILTAFLFTLVFLTGHYDQVWCRRTGELFGMFFLFGAFISFFIWMRKDSGVFALLGTTGVLLAAMSKESFIVLIPAVGLLLVLLVSNEKNISLKQSFFRTRKIQWVFFISLVVLCLGVLHSMQAETTYSFRASWTLYFKLAIRNFRILSGPVIWWLPLVAAFVFLIKEKRFSGKHFLLFLAGVAWIGSQLLVYRETPISDYGRYLLPSVLFPLLISASLLEKFKAYSGKKTYLCYLLILSGFVIVNAKNCYINSSYYSARATSYHRMLDEIAKTKAGEKDQLLFLVEQGGLYDFMESSAVFLSWKGVNLPLSYFEILKNGRVKKYLPEEIITEARKIKTTAESDRVLLLSELKDPKTRFVIFSTPEPFSKLNPTGFSEGFSECKKFPEVYYNTSWREILHGNLSTVDTVQYFLLKK